MTDPSTGSGHRLDAGRELDERVLGIAPYTGQIWYNDRIGIAGPGGVVSAPGRGMKGSTSMRGQSTKIPRVCERCGATFFVTQADLAWSGRRFCSRACYYGTDADRIARFWQKVDKSSDANGCWLWTAHKCRGYGTFGWNGSTKQAHRVAYELTIGPIPAGLTIDHLCRNRSCVNPAHLEPVTMKVNVLRGNAVTAINARKTHCIHGHPYDDSNTRRRPMSSHRSCKTCAFLDNRERKALAKAARKVARDARRT
jgi:hypothetical protein